MRGVLRQSRTRVFLCLLCLLIVTEAVLVPVAVSVARSVVVSVGPSVVASVVSVIAVVTVGFVGVAERWFCYVV